MNKKQVEFKNCTFNINVVPASENTRDEVVLENTSTSQEPSMQEMLTEFLEIEEALLEERREMLDALQELEGYQSQSISMKKLE